MSPLYSLKELLKLLQRQKKEGYTMIEAIVNLMEYKSDTLPEDKKLIIIVDLFRKYGLYEIGFEGEKTFKEDVTELKSFEEVEFSKKEIDWFIPPYSFQKEQYNIQILNSIIKFEVYMN